MPSKAIKDAYFYVGFQLCICVILKMIVSIRKDKLTIFTIYMHTLVL